ncbi:MAG: HNH endonuclease [Acholeplasma sp.]|nr:HNH endonuclease [Acholeplasma sp.]
MSLNQDNLELLCRECHKKVHERFFHLLNTMKMVIL